MREVFKNLWICNQNDQIISPYPNPFETEWAAVFAAKEPWHRNELQYTGRACDKSHPEYLMAKRGSRLILNLVDAPKAEFFDKRIIDAALNFIGEQLEAGRKVAVVCNEGRSRSASICLLYLIKHGIIKGDTLDDCEAEFLKVYPEYNPGTGMRGFVKEHWKSYKNL